jgi:putative ABC transport system ATP-binding protein
MSVEINNIPAIKDRKSDGRLRGHLPTLIELRNVVKIYESAAGKFAALNGVNLKIYPGEFIAVIGKSGSGKTTLMNMITGIDRPTIGEVIIGGTPIHTLNEGQTAVWRGNTVGVVFQFFQLLPTLTVIENVMLPMDFCHRYSLRERFQRALMLLDQVELIEYANRLPSALSGGQQQRVAIARALANDPPVLIADEPTGNLDSNTAASVFSLFEKLVRQGKTIVMVTHDQDLVKQVVRTIYIKDGRITGDQTLPSDRIRVPHHGNQDTERESDPLRMMVSEILDDRPESARKLRTALQDGPKDRQERDALYRAIFEEIKYRADQAEQAGETEEARNLWGILVDATGK